MNCKKCGKELDASWIACPYCGRKVAVEKKHRRPNGMGDAYMRGKTWTARVTIETREENGKVKQIRRTKGGFTSRTEALKYCPQLYTADSKKRTPTLAYYYNTFESGKMEKLSDSKRTAYKIAWARLASVKDRYIDSLSVGELQALMNEQCPTYYPARDLRVLLNHLFKLAAADGNANPSLPGLLELPKLEEGEREPFTEEEQKLLWKAYEKGNLDAGLPLLMIYTGMMTGEIRKLHTDMIHWADREIVGVGLKTKERKRKSVLLPETIMPVLESIAAGKDGLLYPMPEDDFYTLYYAALTSAGITRHLTPYSCRHTTATALAIDENVAPQTIRRIMRWSSTRMLDRYAHPTDDDARAALNQRL